MPVHHIEIHIRKRFQNLIEWQLLVLRCKSICSCIVPLHGILLKQEEKNKTKKFLHLEGDRNFEMEMTERVLKVHG